MRVIDSHTGGQPTRVIVSGGPDLGDGPLAERREIFANTFDHFRTMSVREPKCADAMVGALLCEPVDPACSAGVIFFNTAGYLGMCGHGAIGLAATLAHLEQIKPGPHLIETPVGRVKIDLLDANEARIENVESYCLETDVAIDVGALGVVTGSIAWGGNWFFLVDQAPAPIDPNNIPILTEAAWKIRRTLAGNGITGAGGAEIDHIEFFEPVAGEEADSKNFVLCPGGAYDRSPCGTGTSAKLACLAAAGKLAPGEEWVQKSIIGSRFRGTYQPADEPGRIIPTITGNAYVYAETELVFAESDPFRWGIR